MTALTTDRLRLVSFGPGGQVVAVKDLLDSTAYAHVRDSFKLTAPAKQRAASPATRRFGGQRIASEAWENGAITAEWLVTGASASAALTSMSALLASFEDLTPDQYLEWRPTGAAQSTYFEIRGSADWQPEYKWVEFSSKYTLHVTAKFVVAPLGLADPLDAYDDFNADTIAAGDWTVSEGTGASVAITSSQFTVVSNYATRHVVVHTGRGHTYTDVQATVRVPITSLNNGLKVGVQLCNLGSDANLSASSASNPGVLEVYLTRVGGVANLIVSAWRAGTETVLVTSAAVTLTAGNTYYVVGRREGNVVTAELWEQADRPSYATTTLGVRNTTTRLASTDITLFATPGRVGVVMQPQVAGALAIDDAQIQAYAYVGRQAPGHFLLPGIPGDAPPRVDTSISVAGFTAVPVWAVASGGKQPSAFNLVQNGDFELVGAVGWSTAITDVNAAAATSIAATTSVAKFGSTSLNVITPATTDAGVNTIVSRSPRDGAIYTASAWVRSTGASVTAAIRLGQTGNVATSTPVTLSATWQLISVTWQAGSWLGKNAFYLGVVQTSSTATTFQIDGVMVYEGATPPTGFAQIEGRGALPAAGVIEAESSIATAMLTGGDVAASGGLKLSATSGTSGGAQWFVDPSLVASDAFTQGEIDVEVWIRWGMSTGTTSVVWTANIQAERGLTYGAARYTDEWGSAGYAVMTPTSAANRIDRLGTLRFTVDPNRPQRQALVVAWTAAANSGLTLDYVILVPLRRRAAAPTGRVLDSTYPRLLPSAAGSTGITKTIRYDGSGIVRYQGDLYGWPEHGLSSGVPLEAGTNEVVVDVSGVVPANPTASASSDDRPQLAVQFSCIPRFLLARPS